MKKQPSDQPIEETIRHVESLTAGDPKVDDAVRDAQVRVQAARAAAQNVVCPRDLQPAAANVLLDFQQAIDAAGLLPFEPMVPALVALHAACVDTYPELAAVVRGLRGQRLVRLHARRGASPEPEAQTRAEASAVDAFVTAIAGHLRDRGALLPHSGLLVEQFPDFDRRLAAVARRHADAQAEHARAAADAAECDRAEAAAAAAKEAALQGAVRLLEETPDQRDRRAQLAAWFRRQGQWVFPIDGTWLSAEACAEALDRGEPFGPFYRVQSQGQPPARQRMPAN